jgi:hypothetical protein
LRIRYVRDGQNQILGHVTDGFPNSDTVARDRSGRILGHANSLFHNTRDATGCLVSRDCDDVGLLFRR